jgi:hypothetical protein
MFQKFKNNHVPQGLSRIGRRKTMALALALTWDGFANNS